MIPYELSLLVIFILPYLRGLSQFPHNRLDNVSLKSMEDFPLRPQKNQAFFVAFQLFLPSSLSVFISEMKKNNKQKPRQILYISSAETATAYS